MTDVGSSVTREVPLGLVRGGTSKGVFLHWDDVPADVAERDELVLRLMGTPDPMQIDGLGGSHSSTSKVVVVRRSEEDGVDVDYLFLQVGIDRAVVDTASNCGNLTAAVGPWAVESGLVKVEGDRCELRLRNLNTGVEVRSAFGLVAGMPAVLGDAVVEGVPGTGAPVELGYVEPGGAVTGRLLPTGSVVDTVAWRGGEIEVSIVDASSLVVFVKSQDLGLLDARTPEQLAGDLVLLADLEELRASVADRLGVHSPVGSSIPSPAVPRITIVSTPGAADPVDLRTLSLSLQRVHHAIPSTSLMCTAAAAEIAGTVVHQVTRPTSAARLVIGHPKGVASVAVDLDDSAEPHLMSLGVISTARTLLTGTARVTTPVKSGTP